MRLINKRYRINSKISKSRNGIYYKVTDIYDKKIRTLKFFNSDKYSDTELEEFRKEFVFRSNIDLPCFNEVDEFSTVWNIDNNNLNSDYCFYTIKNDNTSKILSGYKFKNKKDKLNIFRKIKFYLDYLHKNGFYHGDLSENSIEISKNKNIIFTKFNIHGSKKRDLRDFKKLKEMYNIDNRDLKKIDIKKEEVFRFLKQNFNFKLNFNAQLREDIDQKFYNVLSGDKSVIFNLSNFDRDYYIAASSYLRANLLTHNYKVFTIEGNSDILNILKKFIKNVNKHKQFSNFIKENRDFVKMIFNKKLSNLNFNKIFSFIRNLVEKMTLKNNIAVVFNDLNSISKEKIKYFRKIINNFDGNKLILILNDNKLLFENNLNNNNIAYIKYDVSPTRSEYSKYNLKKLSNLFFYIEINKKLDVLRKHNYFDIHKIISYIINIYSRKPETGSEILNEETLTELIHSEYYIIDFYFEKEYKRLLSFLCNMNKPVFLKYLRNHVKNLDEKVRVLIDAKILKFNQSKYLGFYDVNYDDYISKKFNNLDDDFRKKIHYSIIQIYEEKLENLNNDELIALAYNYYYVNEHEKLKNLLIDYFIRNYRINRSFFKSKIKNLLNLLISNLDRVDTINKNIRAIYLLANTLFKNPEDLKKREVELKAIEKLNVTDKQIKFIIIKELFEIYYRLNDKDRLDEYFNEASKLLPYLEFIDQIHVYNMLIDYYFNQNQPAMVKKMCNLIMRKIYDKRDKYRYIYLNIINKLALYYSSNNEPQKQLNTYRLLLKRANEFKFRRYIMIAHNGMGVIFVHKGEHEKARKHFSKILELASKVYDYDFLITGNINIAIVNQNFDEVKKYYLQALKYAEKINKYNNILLILTNLFEIISDRKLYNLIKKHEAKIKNSEYCLNNFRHYGHFYYMIILLLMRMNKLDSIYEYYEILKNLNISKDNTYYSYYELLILVYEKLLGNVAIDYTKIKNLMYEVESYFLEIYVIIIFIWFYESFNEKEKNDWLDSVYKQLDEENFENYKLRIKILMQIRMKGVNAKIIRDIGRIKFDLQDYFDIYLYLYLGINKAYYRKNNNKEFLSLINYLLNYYKMFYNKFKNKNLLELTIFPSLRKTFQKYFPALFESFLLNNEKMIRSYGNIGSYMDKIHFYEEEKSKSFISNMLKETLNTSKYDRAIFYSVDGNKKRKEVSVVTDKLIYVSNRKTYFEKYYDNLGKDILIHKMKGNYIKKAVLIPIIDKSIYKRYEYKKKHKMKLNNVKFKYLNGVVYLDKKNTVIVENEETIFKFVQSYFSQYWEKHTIQRKFLRDNLTNLFLKEEFMKRSKEYINNDNIKNKKYSIIMADLDNFKNINDTFGHQKGDEVLKGISGIIKKNIRPFDIAARYGGEEFIIGLENTDLYTAGKIAERIRRKIEEKQLMKNIRNLTISIGVSNYPKDSILLTELISKADSRLYKAKRQGKNQVCKI